MKIIIIIIYSLEFCTSISAKNSLFRNFKSYMPNAVDDDHTLGVHANIYSDISV